MFRFLITSVLLLLVLSTWFFWENRQLRNSHQEVTNQVLSGSPLIMFDFDDGRYTYRFQKWSNLEFKYPELKN